MRETVEQALAGIVGEYEQTVITQKSGTKDYRSWERRSVNRLYDAMMEPTREMIEAGNTVSEDAGDVWAPSEGISYGGPSCGLEVWQAMIRAAKEERDGLARC